MITTPSDSSGSDAEEATPAAGTQASKSSGSAPGEGAWSRREARKAAIALKDSEIYEQGAGDGEAWKKKRKRAHTDPMENSLAMILESLRGYEVTIDLKNDITVKGRIESVDKGMNVILENADDSPSSSSSASFSSGKEDDETATKETQTQTTEIKGTSIYLVHMPSGLDISSHVEKYRFVKEKEKKSRSMKTKSLTAQA